MSSFSRSVSLGLCFFPLLQSNSVWAQSAEDNDSQPPPVFAEHVDWKRVVRGFRHDHNFALNIAYSKNDWKGYLQRTSEDFRAQSQALELQVDYSFHLPLIGSLGYSLGTGVAYVLQDASEDPETFNVKQAYSLPGIAVGLIWNISERWRSSATFVYGWQRIESLHLTTPFARETIAVTGDARSLRWSIDYFVQLSWALRIELEDVSFSYASKESINLDKAGEQLRIGLVKHLL